MTANVVQTGLNHPPWTLVVANTGRALARSVDVVAEVPFGTRSEPVWASSPFPCDVPPGGDAKWAFYLALGGQVSRLQVSVTWTDGAGAHEFTALLSL